MNKEQFSTIDDYIALQRQEVRATLEEFRYLIQKAVPKAEQVISYQMPAFKFHGMLAYFAVYKNHYGLYVPRVIHEFKKELTSYKWSKATIQFPIDKPIPKKLITAIIKRAVQLNLENKLLKEEAKAKKKKK